VIAGEVDHCVGRIQSRVLERSQRLGVREIDALRKRRVESFEVRRRVTRRQEEPVTAPSVGAFDAPERGLDALAVAVGRPTVPSVVQIQQHVVAGSDDVAVIVPREGLVPGVLAPGM
jgi:hypothetical protein